VSEVDPVRRRRTLANPLGIGRLLKTTFDEWLEDKAPRLAAALAYYTIFAMTPVLVIAIGVAGFFLEGVEEHAVAQIQQVVGPHAAKAVRGMLAQRTGSGDFKAALLGFATLLIGATGLFAQLQDALNTIWEVQPRPNQGILGTIRNRLFSFAMVLGIGFLLLVSLVGSAILTAFLDMLGGPAEDRAWIWRVFDVAVSLGAITGLFALIFRIIPDAEVEWRDVWVGAATSALLFTVGKQLISRYLATEAVASSYGAAGALVLLLIWIYYSAQILLFGAELTQVYACTYGAGIRPSRHAMRVGEEVREREGMPHASA
jgi:membrane protein